MSSIRRCGLSVLFLCPALCAQSVRVVDQANGPGTDFTRIEDAVYTAPSGCVVLVRAGSYFEPVSVVAKSLTITAESGAFVGLNLVGVFSLSAGQTVVLRG